MFCVKRFSLYCFHSAKRNLLVLSLPWVSVNCNHTQIQNQIKCLIQTQNGTAIIQILLVSKATKKLGCQKHKFITTLFISSCFKKRRISTSKIQRHAFVNESLTVEYNVWSHSSSDHQTSSLLVWVVWK